MCVQERPRILRYCGTMTPCKVSERGQNKEEGHIGYGLGGRGGAVAIQDTYPPSISDTLTSPSHLKNEQSRG